MFGIVVFYAITVFLLSLMLLLAIATNFQQLEPDATAAILNIVLTLSSYIVAIIVSGLFIFKLYNVKPDLITWIHITFGLIILLEVFTTILSDFESSELFSVRDLLDPVLVFPVMGMVGIWITFVMHLKQVKKGKTMDFS